MENNFFKGKLFASCDQGSIAEAMTCGMQVIALVDVGQAYQYQSMGCVVISSLLPPPEVITDILNGNLPQGIQKYKMFLASSNNEQTIVCLLAALHQKPMGFLLYTEYDSDREFHILETISQFLVEVFGIIVGIFRNPKYPATSIKDPQFDYRIADLLFVNNFIDRKIYAMLTPLNAVPSPRACQVLLKHINYGFNSMEDCVKACLGMLNDIRQEIQTGKVNPMMIVPPGLTPEQMNILHQRRMEQEIIKSGNVVT